MAVDDEDELAARQDARLYPVGRVLRATFDADNHDSLDPVVTSLMINLSHIEAGSERVVVETARQTPPTLVDRVIAMLTARRDERHQ